MARGLAPAQSRIGKPLEELAIDPSGIDSALRPFLVSEDNTLRWRAEVARRWLSTVARTVTGRELHRDRGTIEREYEKAWGAGYRRYRLDRTDLKPTPWSWRGRKLLLDGSAAARFRTLLFAALFEQLKPRTVLEVGSGNGINLLALAGGFPDIALTGLELTEEGVAQARRAQSDPETVEIVRTYSPVATRDPRAIERIAFVQGDASALPFAEGSFDLVMTVLAVEQMESIRAAALGEIARVARSHVLMLEPFRNANASPLKRLYVRSRGYFRGSVGELREFGLEPVCSTGDYPQEAFLGTLLVLARKAG